MNSKQKLIRFCLQLAALFSVLTSHAGPAVVSISAGDQHCLFLKSDGSLWAMGYNAYGQLGDGSTNDHLVPEMIVASNVTAIAAGGNHSIFVKTDGSLWVMGYNGYGQLGDGITNNLLLPSVISSSGIAAVSAGDNHSLYRRTDGSLWAMGNNDYGQLGDGTTVNRLTPVEVTNAGVSVFSAGGDHSMFVVHHGSGTSATTTLYAMGLNYYGQLGDSTTVNRSSPVKIVTSTLMSGSPVTAVSAGSILSLFVEGNGSLWAMGDNSYGELGDGTYTEHNSPEEILPNGVTAVSASSGYGTLFSLYLKSDGTLWGMGDATYGELGIGQDYYMNGGFIIFPSPQLITSNGVSAISAGIYNSFYVKQGNLWAMGDNSNGQMGDGAPELANEIVPFPEFIVAGPPPAIAISSVSNTPIVLFPTTGATTYVLQISTNLNSTNWTTVTNAVPFSGLQIPNAPGTAFFRLVSP